MLHGAHGINFMLFEEKDADLLLNSNDNLLNKVKQLDLTKSFIVKDPGVALQEKGLSPQYRENISDVLPDGRREIRENLEYTTAERSLAAALSRIDTIENVSKVTGASVRQISNWRDGKASWNGKPHPELMQETNKKLGKIRDVAMDKLLITLGIIKDEKLEELGQKDLSIVAGNLARVVEKTLPREENASGANVILYAPTQMNVEEYNVVEG